MILSLLLAAGGHAALKHEGATYLLHWNSHRDGNYEVYRREADGTDSNLTRRASDEWLWSAHDGHLYALSNAREESEQKGWRPVRMEGEVLPRLAPDPVGDGFIDCHPSGKPCAADIYDAERRRHVVLFDAPSKYVQLLDTGEQESADPQWSPDGKQLLFRSNRGGSWELWLADAKGGNARVLTTDPANDGVIKHEYGGEGPARFSPDGKRIAWMRKFPGKGYDVWTMAVDGSNARNLTEAFAGDDAYPSFSPDGAWVAFDSDRDGDNEVYVMAADGSAPQRITNANGADMAPLWVRSR